MKWMMSHSLTHSLALVPPARRSGNVQDDHGASYRPCCAQIQRRSFGELLPRRVRRFLRREAVALVSSAEFGRHNCLCFLGSSMGRYPGHLAWDRYVRHIPQVAPGNRMTEREEQAELRRRRLGSLDAFVAKNLSSATPMYFISQIRFDYNSNIDQHSCISSGAATAQGILRA